jgi:hypothetical protein
MIDKLCHFKSFSLPEQNKHDLAEIYPEHQISDEVSMEAIGVFSEKAIENFLRWL